MGGLAHVELTEVGDAVLRRVRLDGGGAHVAVVQYRADQVLGVVAHLDVAHDRDQQLRLFALPIQAGPELCAQQVCDAALVDIPADARCADRYVNCSGVDRRKFCGGKGGRRCLVVTYA